MTVGMKRIAYIFSVLVVALIAANAQAADKPLTVVELYTSQGCSSCPPADAYLGKLAERDDILALSLHVDYWDYIGWKDKFAFPANTVRQRAYARNLGMGYVYTPQMVVQGMAHTTGSNKDTVENLINDLRGAKRLDVEVTHAGDALNIKIPGGTFDNEDARILVAAFDSKHVTDVQRGENAGRDLAYYNVVRDMVDIGVWSGDALSLKVTEQQIEMTGRNGCAVLVQSTKIGRILGAAKVMFPPQS